MFEGKLYLRELTADTHEPSFGIGGVIAVPKDWIGECIYPAVVSDLHGIRLENTPRVPADIRDIGVIDANGIIISLQWARGAFPDVCELFLRDTELPDAPAGAKWVIAAGASRMHVGQTRMISSYGGKTVVDVGERWQGDTYTGILRNPIWGAQHNPCDVSVHLALDRYEAEFVGSRFDDPEFAEFKRQMELKMPSKTWYTVKEHEERDIAAAEIMRNIMASSNPVTAPAMA